MGVCVLIFSLISVSTSHKLTVNKGNLRLQTCCLDKRSHDDRQVLDEAGTNDLAHPSPSTYHVRYLKIQNSQIHLHSSRSTRKIL